MLHATSQEFKSTILFLDVVVRLLTRTLGISVDWSKDKENGLDVSEGILFGSNRSKFTNSPLRIRFSTVESGDFS